jgi:hypothetical protein
LTGIPIPDDQQWREAELRDFVDFLDERAPPLAVSDSLSAVLRTEPPIRFGVPRVVEAVAVWAERRAAASGDGRVCDRMALATRKIVEAYRANILTGFDPKSFYRPFVLGLMARCPVDERDDFQSALRGLRANISPRWDAPATAELGAAETVDVRGYQVRREKAVGEVARWIEGEPNMWDEEFEAALATIDLVLRSRAGVPLKEALTRLVEASVALFNAARTDRAARLVSLVAGIEDRLQLTPGERGELRQAVRADRLDRAVLASLVADPRHHAEARPIVRHFAELGAGLALDRLEAETSRERRRFLLNLVEVHGSTALPAVLERLNRASNTTLPWYLTRNLIYLVSRVEPLADADRRAVFAALEPYVTTDIAQLRGAALEALRRLGGGDAVAFLVKALDIGEVRPWASDAERDALEHELLETVEWLAGHDLERAVVVAAQYALGARGAESGFARSLRYTALVALAARHEPLPRRAVLALVAHLRQQAERRTKHMGTFSLGVDLVACRRMVQLLVRSNEPEAVEVVATPFAQKLLARGTGELVQGASLDE